ncbi:MAG TPA: beta-ketoacyl synthase chain length factor [Steroidobacteraceae bacterium]
MSAYIEGIGVLGPGLSDWPGTAAILAGTAEYVAAPTVLPAPWSLPPAERRRAVAVVKLALAIGFEATTRAGIDRRALPTVFSSSGGDGSNCHEICQALASADRQISPTRFHNSVHNVGAGYWSIAAKATAAANVLCAFDASFVAGLLEALAQVTTERAPTLLLAYDTQYPEPLHSKRPLLDAFGVAFVIAPAASAAAMARLSAVLSENSADRMREARLEALRVSIPAARSLPLLQILARRRAGSVTLDYLENLRLSIEVEPCH